MVDNILSLRQLLSEVDVSKSTMNQFSWKVDKMVKLLRDDCHLKRLRPITWRITVECIVEASDGK